MTQFFYTRKEPIQGTNPIEFKDFLDSFNTEKVIRTVTVEDGQRLVLLDDIHERAMDVPDIDPRTGKLKGKKRERNTYQTEIYLSPEDSERFVELMTIN